MSKTELAKKFAVDVALAIPAVMTASVIVMFAFEIPWLIAMAKRQG